MTETGHTLPGALKVNQQRDIKFFSTQRIPLKENLHTSQLSDKTMKYNNYTT